MSKQLAKITVKRMISAASLKSQGDLAKLLGITSQAISSTVAKGKIPERWFDLFNEKFGVSKEALSETPEEKLVRTYGKNPVTASKGIGWRNDSSPGEIGGVNTQEAKPGNTTPDEFDMPEMVKMTMIVLASDTVYKPALASNIRAFHKAVTMEGEMNELKNDVKEIKQQNADLCERLQVLTEALLAAGIALPKRDTAA